jgi:phosphatidylserine decarboxylase
MIASYGLKFIAVGIVLVLIAVIAAALAGVRWLYFVATVLGILTIFLIYFYRNPPREIPGGGDLILSIADGRILSVEKITNEFIGGKGMKISIFLSILDVHINRIPISGRLDYVKYVPGRFFRAFVEKASEENEHTEIGLTFNNGRMIFKQIAGILARRIECNSKPDQQVKSGEIFGMIHFGSRAELFLPDNIEVIAKKGDKVKAGETIIGRLRNS